MSSHEPNLNETSSASPAAEASAAAAPEAARGDEVAKLTAERAELNDRLLRLAADFENYKRRIRKETEEAGLRSQEALLKEFLTPLDNLDRALMAAKKSENPALNVLLEGMQMVQKQFFAALEKFQVKPFDAQGQAFDPQFHEAVSQVDSDTLPAGTVAAVFQRGYFIGTGNRLLRPAVVSVVRAGAAPSAAGDNYKN